MGLNVRIWLFPRLREIGFSQSIRDDTRLQASPGIARMLRPSSTSIIPRRGDGASEILTAAPVLGKAQLETQREQARENFALAVRKRSADIDLFSACLHIAAEEYENLDTEKYSARVDELTGMVKDRVPSTPSHYDYLHSLNEVLFGIVGLRGNNENYYDPRNSFLNEVMDRGLGIPITLSIIYMEVGARAGLTMRGVGMPGHFLVIAGEGADEIFIDPYHRGGLLSRKEGLALALRGKNLAEKSSATLMKRLLPVNGSRSILRRLLTNLKLTYAKKRDYKRSLASAERIQLLDPGNWRNLSDLARLQAEVGDFIQAVESLSAYLDKAPEGADTRRAKTALGQLKELARRQSAPEAGTA